uniref:EF-hand domain-containing protein n=1 Tax=Globisporangium ultimum (strain ATCC 200006 / CBS 805.95 / DAOM BR144) TaxID=431595 RepID=K3X0V2_GLOUD
MTREDLARAITPYTYRSGAPLASKNIKFNPKANAGKPSKEIVDAYTNLVKELFLETVEVTAADVNALVAFREENQIDFETHVKVLRNLQITNAEFDQFVVIHGGPVRAKSFFDLVDADGDGLISYAEYMFFNTLLAIPEHQFELAFKMFDSDGNGRLDHREFKQIIDLMRLRTPAGRQDRSLKEEDAPIFKHLFGELATYAFYDLDGNKDLSPREFGMFLVSHVNQKEIGKWVKRVEMLRDMKGHISEQEFMNFTELLEHLDELEVAIDLIMQEHGLNKEQFQRATKAALRGRQNEELVTPLQIDVLFALFDLDGDGHLSPKEFIEVMQKRKDGGFNEPRDTGAFQLINRVKACMETSA